MKFSIEYIEKLMDLMVQKEIGNLHIRDGQRAINMKRSVVENDPAVSPNPVPSSQASPSADAPRPREKETEAEEAGLFEVKSPLVGTFYRSPAPDRDPFVNEGDAVKEGQTLCIVEAMKSMNEIKAPRKGKIREVCIKNASVVEFDQVLFKISPH